MDLQDEMRMAFEYADYKLSQGKLIKASSDYDFDDDANYENGDPETIYTIASLYGQFLTNKEDADALETALMERYPDYI